MSATLTWHSPWALLVRLCAAGAVQFTGLGSCSGAATTCPFSIHTPVNKRPHRGDAGLGFTNHCIATPAVTLESSRRPAPSSAPRIEAVDYFHVYLVAAVARVCVYSALHAHLTLRGAIFATFHMPRRQRSRHVSRHEGTQELEHTAQDCEKAGLAALPRRAAVLSHRARH